MMKNIIRLIIPLFMIIFCGLSHDALAMLGRAGQVVKQSTRIPRPAPGTAPSPQSVPISIQKRELPPELPQPGRPRELSQPSPDTMKESIQLAPNSTATKVARQPRYSRGDLPSVKPQSRWNSIRNIQAQQTPKTVSIEIIEDLKKLKADDHPGSLVAEALILEEPIISIEKILKEESSRAQQSGYRIGFIDSSAHNTRAMLAQLFGKSLDDISTLKSWHSIDLENIPFLEFLQLPDQSIIFLERTSQPYPLLIGSPSPLSSIRKLDQIIGKQISDDQGVDIIQSAQRSALQEAQAYKSVQAEKEKALHQEVDTDFDALENELAQQQAHISLKKQSEENLKTIAQTAEEINTKLDKELQEFQANQAQLKAQRLTQAMTEAKKTTAFRNLDSEQQEKFLTQLENNYNQKIAQDLATKKDAIDAEKNKRIQEYEEASTSNIKELEAKKEELEQQQKDAQEKKSEQEALLLEIINDTKDLTAMIQEHDANELAMSHIRQNKLSAQETFKREKERIRSESEQLLQNAEKEKAARLKKSTEELEKTRDFINADLAQQAIIIQRLENNTSREYEEIKRALEKKEKQRSQDVDQREQQQLQELQVEQQQLEQKQAQLELQKTEYRQKLEQRIAQEEETIVQQEQALEQAFQQRKAEIRQQRKIAQEKAVKKQYSDQQEIQKLDQELQALQEAHTISMQLVTEQSQRVEQARIEVQEIKEQELQAEQARVKKSKEEAQQKLRAAQEKKLQQEIEIAQKKAELELINKNKAQAENILVQAERAVELKKIELQEQAKLAQEIQQQQEAEKQTLTQAQQDQLLIEQDENQKKFAIEEARLQQELAEKELARIEAEIRAQEIEQARIQTEQAIQTASEKTHPLAEKKADVNMSESVPKTGAKEPVEKQPMLRDEEPEVQPEKYVPQSEQVRPETEKQKKQNVDNGLQGKNTAELLLTKIEKEERDDKNEENDKNRKEKKELEIPGGDDELPSDDENNSKESQNKEPQKEESQPVQPKGKLPKVSIPAIGQPFTIPAVLSEERGVSGQVNKVKPPQPSPLEVPAITLEEPTPTIILPEPKKPSTPPLPPRTSELKTYPQSPTKPITSPDPIEQPSGLSLPVDMDPLRLIPFETSPFPERTIATYQAHIPQGTSAPSATPRVSSGVTPSSGSFDWPTFDQPATYVPVSVKTSAPLPGTSKKNTVITQSLNNAGKTITQEKTGYGISNS